MKQFIENGVRVRFFYAGNIAISEDGSIAKKLKIGKISRKFSAEKRNMKIWEDSRGECYVKAKQWNKEVNVYVANAVAACFCPPPTKIDDGKKRIYQLVHIDGDLKNNNYKNLEWREKKQYHSANDSETILVHGHLIKVNKDATFYDCDQKKDVSINTYLGDSDMDLIDIISPHLCLPAKFGSLCSDRLSIDELMAEAGYIEGDFNGMVNPEILHKDNDWMNFSPDNLKWVEGTSPEYETYQKQKVEDINKMKIKVNGTKQVPDFYLDKYESYKPFWTAKYPFAPIEG